MERTIFYAVHKGRETGIFTNWKEVSGLVNQFPGAKFKKFFNKDEAEAFVKTGIYSKSTLKSEYSEPIPDDENGRIQVFTDGGSSPKTHKASLGVAFSSPHQAFAISVRLKNYTTNQEAELQAIVAALRQIAAHFTDEELITIWTDSDYSIKCVTQYIHIWKKNGWVTATNAPVKHRELIEDLYDRWQKFTPFRVHLRHISEIGLKSHQTHPGTKAPALTQLVWDGNRRADLLATEAMI